MHPSHLFTSPLLLLSHTPIGLFVLVSSFLEEIFSPLPSAFITIATGSYALTHGKGYLDLVLLSLISGLGKTVASYFYYILADKGEDFVLKKYGKFIGISHTSIAHVGKLLDKTKRDDFLLFFTRAFPLFPTAPVSFFCGLIKQNIRTYLLMSFLGFSVRSFLYLLIGYYGIDVLSLLHNSSFIGFVTALIVLITLSIIFFFWRRKKE